MRAVSRGQVMDERVCLTTPRDEGSLIADGDHGDRMPATIQSMAATRVNGCLEQVAMTNDFDAYQEGVMMRGRGGLPRLRQTPDF